VLTGLLFLHENWGVKFSKHGKLSEAYKGTEDAPVKVCCYRMTLLTGCTGKAYFPDIDATFAGIRMGFSLA